MAETILKGKKFILRHVRMSDLESYHKNLNDKTTAKMMMSQPYPCSLNYARKNILADIKNYKSKKPDGEAFIIDVDGKAIGKLIIKDISYSFLKHRAELAYWIGKDYRNKGIMTEAVKLITKYAFKKYKLKRFVVYTRSFNKASRSTIENAGFKLEGILRKNKWKNGKYLDDCIYAIVR
jgi:RimJ/RimL family protein N-acetyltransferase